MTRLEFKTIRLKNYRQYAGEQEIDLTSRTGRLNIIQGQNGAGKSNLLNAITLCFYGEERRQDDSDEDLESLPYVTRSVLEELDDGDSLSGYIEVELGTDNPEYIFRRTFSTYRVDSGFTNQIGDLTLRRRVGSEWKEPDNPNTHLNQVLPATVSDYFLFDGEDLDAFFEEGYTDRVRDAILDVSHIELLNTSIDHLEKVQTDIERKASNLEGEAGELRDQIDELEDELEEKESELSTTKSDIESTETEIERIDRKLQDISDEVVRDLYTEREELEEDIKEKESKIEDLQKDTVELMVEAGPVVYSSEALDYTLELFNDLSDKGQIPPKIQEWFIDELVERGECICGTELSEGDEHVKHLRELQTDVSEVMEENLEGKSEIPSMKKVASGQVDQIQDRRQQIASLSDEIDSGKERIEEIKNRLKSYDIPDDVDIEALEDNREQLESQVNTLREQKGRIEKEIEDIESKIDSTRTDLHRELEKEDRHQQILKQLDFISDADAQIRDIKQSILADIRESTEENLEQYFNELIWKDEEYDITLYDDYSIAVFDPHGDNKIGSLSAGEKQVLALSFMAALTQISGFNAPILIDTPLGRISSEPKRRIAKNLPKYVEDTQITFLMTDEEYTDEVQAMMQSSLANEYLLEFDNNVTRVVSHA